MNEMKLETEKEKKKCLEFQAVMKIDDDREVALSEGRWIK